MRPSPLAAPMRVQMIVAACASGSVSVWIERSSSNASAMPAISASRLAGGGERDPRLRAVGQRLLQLQRRHDVRGRHRRALRMEGITSVVVEGGGVVHAAFLAAVVATNMD